MLLGLGLIGGAVTALFSVGIGGFLAIFLTLKKFPTKVAIAVAVWVSVVCVLCGVWDNLLSNHIRIEIALFAIPSAIIGAIIGGFLAKQIAQLLGRSGSKPWRLSGSSPLAFSC
jgi:uncharacterized membrane protein YfcA